MAGGEAVLKALRHAGGNRTKVSEELGIDRMTLYFKLHTYAQHLVPDAVRGQLRSVWEGGWP